MTQLAFNYVAIDRTGSKTRGVLRASDRQEAYRQITSAGMKPVKIIARRTSMLRRGGGKVKAKELSHFTYQFGVLMEARIPIADGLRSIAEQEHNVRLRAVIEDVATQIESGCSVTDAMTPHRDLFGEIYIETIRAAEVSGNMIKVLSRLAEMLDQQYETSKSVKGALIYPACVIGALSLAVTFLIIFVVPKFAGMYQARQLDLPLPTQILIGFSSFMRTWWYLLIGGLFAGYSGLRRAWRNPTSREKLDRMLHRIPYLRDILIGLGVSRFSHVFGLCLQSGLGLIEAIDMAGRASGRPLMQADALTMRDQVNHGGRLSDVLLACQYLPGFARRMIAAGEDAAELPKMCEIVARHYDREVTHLTKNISVIIEPVMIIGLAAVVLIVALAIFLPMWNMAALLG